MQFKLTKKAILGVLSTIVLMGGSYGSYYVYNKESLKHSYPDFKVKEYEYIKEVIDGNTVVLQDRKKAQIIGLDVPKNNECFALQSKLALKDLLENKLLKILKYSPGTDLFDGTLVEIVVVKGDLPEYNINAAKYMVENGFGRLKPTDNDYVFDDLTYLQGQAKQKKVGLWSACEK